MRIGSSDSFKEPMRFVVELVGKNLKQTKFLILTIKKVSIGMESNKDSLE